MVKKNLNDVPEEVKRKKAQYEKIMFEIQNYMNFIKVDVSVELPCLPTIAECERTYNIASNWLGAKLEEEMAEAVQNRGPNYDTSPAQAAQPQELSGSGIIPFDGNPERDIG